jgi:CRISPR type III-B/RAMP module RAMP protein Cmr1
MFEINFHLIPLTPFWTGDLDRDSSRLRATGFLGSLRWWYAGLIRALGGQTCSGQGQGKACLYSYEEPEALCPVCRLFGCTGHARRFRLIADRLNQQRLGFTTSNRVYSANSFWLWQTYGGEATGGTKRRDRNVTDYQFGVNQLWGEALRLRVSYAEADRDHIVPALTFLLFFLARYGGLGAKIQNGFGLFELDSKANHQGNIALGKEFITREAQGSKSLRFKTDPRALNIRNFFSYEFALKDFERFRTNLRNIGSQTTGNFNPCAFDLRYKYRLERPSGLRDQIKFSKGKGVANEMLGNSQARSDDERWASKVFVGHPYSDGRGAWFLRVYGYIPPLKALGLDYAQMTTLIRDFYSGQNGVFPGSKIVNQFNFAEEFPHANQT